jgi:hypothetical protein
VLKIKEVIEKIKATTGESYSAKSSFRGEH